MPIPLVRLRLNCDVELLDAIADEVMACNAVQWMVLDRLDLHQWHAWIAVAVDRAGVVAL